MSTRVKLSSFLVVLSIVGLLGIVGFYHASAEVPPTFVSEVNSLVTLKVLPDKNWTPTTVVTYRDYVTYGEKLIHGRRPVNYIVDPTSTLATPDAPITYEDALLSAGKLLGYAEEAAFAKMTELTPKLIKGAKDTITGYEMAYIFYTVLYQPKVGAVKTVLEEEYVIGANESAMSRVLQITNKIIVTKMEDTLPLAADALAFTFDSTGKILPLSFGAISVGMSNLKYLVNEAGEVATVFLPKKVYPEQIRVLISSDLSTIGGSNSYDFNEVKISGDKMFKVITSEKGKETVHYVADRNEYVFFTNVEGKVKLTVGKFSQVLGERVTLESFYPHKTNFKLTSTKRVGRYPTYEGSIEIIPSQKVGALYVINDLHIENYLKKVVPSEIPTDWSKEAFKVQAIAARSYAISQIAGSRYEDKSANVDDSTACQVYNNINENAAVNEAIAETAGVVPLYNGSVIDAVFASTTSGFTANTDEVWHAPDTLIFPGNPVPYLKAKSQIIGATVSDLSNEANALAFYKDWTLKGYDSISPFFRWKLELTREELENTINKNLPGREKADITLQADFIQTIEGTPIPVNDTAFSIGTLKDIKVVRRGQGGNLMSIDIVGSNGTYRILKEYNIRFVIRPVNTMTGTKGDVIITRYDGTTIKNYSILPSAFASFEILRDEKGDITKVAIYGGGNGHGVGMSQWGMKGMVDMGYKYDYILKHYYSGIELVKIY